MSLQFPLSVSYFQAALRYSADQPARAFRSGLMAQACFQVFQLLPRVQSDNICARADSRSHFFVLVNFIEFRPERVFVIHAKGKTTK